MLIWYLFILICGIGCAHAARFNVVGSQNEDQYIRLKSQYDMTPGKVLKLPIDVPKEYISLYGTLPPRLLSITTPNPDNVYGTGDIIYIDLKFTIDVLVNGIPSLTLNTGCSENSCRTKEIQTFTCNADTGKFAIRLEDQFLMNIDANITKEELKEKIEEFHGINRVTIEFGDKDDRQYSGGNRVCTSIGNTVTITFDDVYFPQYNGDVPLLIFDQTNTYVDLRSGLNLGEENTFLTSIQQNSRKFTVNITASQQLNKGIQQRDGIAYYIHGNGTDTIRFRFIAQNGDYTEKLDVKALNFLEGYVYSPITYANVSTNMPYFGAGPRYMIKAAQALSFQHNIKITSAIPQIISLTSPELDGIYTQGDMVSIYIQYDLAVKVYNGEYITIQLSTGAFDRIIPYKQQYSSTILEFEYIVQEGDTSLDLDITSSTALILNQGAIYRDTSTNETIANISLPFPGQINSLSYNKDIIINTLSSQIININVYSDVGIYTAGDFIDIEVMYGNPVTIYNQPRLLISNTMKEINNIDIKNAPFIPTISYMRGQPNEIIQAIFTLQVNWNLDINDQIILNLPNFYILDPVFHMESNRTMSITATTSSNNNNSSSGSSNTMDINNIWIGKTNQMVITLNTSIDKNSILTICIHGRSGLYAPSAPILSDQSDLTFQIISPNHINTINTTTSSSTNKLYNYEYISAIGFEKLSLSITPTKQNTILTIVLSFSVPELIELGDEISLYLPNFLVQNSSLYDIHTQPVVYGITDLFNYTYSPNISEFRMIFTTSTSISNMNIYKYNIPISDYIQLTLPSTGITSSSISLSANMTNNGILTHIKIPNIIQICGFLPAVDDQIEQFPSVIYQTKLPGVTSAVQFLWQMNIEQYTIGNSIIFTLPTYNTNLYDTIYTIPSTAITSIYKEYFTITIYQDTVTFRIIKNIPMTTDTIDITIHSSVGLLVPLTGIQPYREQFSSQIISTTCVMSKEWFYFHKNAFILPITLPMIELTPSLPSIDESVTLNIHFLLSSTLETNDYFYVTIPEFTRDILLDPYNLNISSNAELSSRYNRRLERIEFTVLTEFNINASTVELYVTVNSSTGLIIPKNGLSFTTFYLSMYSQNYGDIEQLHINGPCIGFCSSILYYSTYFEAQELVLTAVLSYSDILPSNHILTFDMTGFYVSNILALESYIYTTTTTIYTAIIEYKNGLVNITLPFTIPAETEYTIVLYGFELSNSTSNTYTPTLSTTSRNHSTLQSDRKTTFFYPTQVHKQYRFDTASITFDTIYNNNVASTTATMILEFLNPSNQVLYDGFFIDIILPNFGLNINNIVSSNNVIDLSEINWNEQTYLLRLPITRYINNTEIIKISINSVILPVIGVSNNLSVNNISYSIGVEPDSRLISLSRSFTSIQEVLRITDTSIDFTYTTDYCLSTIQIGFTTASVLNMDDVVVITLPGLSILNEALSSNTTAQLTVLSSTLRGTAIWYQNSSSIVLVIDSYSGSGVHTLQIDTISSNIIILNTGISADTYATYSIVLSSGQTTTDTNILLPCIGVCSTIITPTVRKAGFPTEYTVVITLGTHEFVYGDRFTMELEGFRKKTTSSIVVTGYDSLNNNTYSFNVTMLNDTTSLNVVFAMNMSVDARFQTISFVLPQKFGLYLPISGIESTDRFELTWYSLLRNNNYTYINNIISFQPVGKLLLASLQISPRIPSTPAEYEFAFRFNGRLLAGDYMRIYLPSFIVPAGELTLVPGIIFGYNITSIQVIGVPGTVTELINVDNSKYQLNNIAYIQITLLEDLNAEEDFIFTIRNSSLLIIPSTGIYRDTVPWVSVSSTTSPITAVQLQNYTHIGSLSPATYILESEASGYRNTNKNKTQQLELEFTVNCPLFSGDSISVYIPNMILSTTTPSSTTTFVPVTSNRNVNITTEWVSATSTMNLTLDTNSYILSGVWALTIDLSGFNITDNIIYQNDPRLVYMITSDTCSIDGASFDNTTASHLLSSAISFKPTAAIAQPTPLTLSINTVQALHAGDIISLNLPDFRLLVNNTLLTTTNSFLVTVDGPSVFDQSALVVYNTTLNRVTILYHIIETTTVSTIYTLYIPESTDIAIVLPVEGISMDYNHISIQAYRQYNNDSNINSYDITNTKQLFQGYIQTLPNIWYVLTTSIVIDNPLPSANSGFLLSWSLSQPIPAEGILVFTLPGVMNTKLSLTSLSTLEISGIAAQYFTAKWNPVTSEILLLAKSIVPRIQLLTIEIINSQGFITPTNGIPSINNIYTISLIVNNNLVLEHIITEITVVPVILTSTIQFIGSNSDESFELEGDPYIMQLYPDHPLLSLDAGAQLVIDNAYYTIVDVRDNLLYLLEPYRGQRIFMSYPAMPVYTPPYRFADYYSGTGTSSILFRYQVRRYDYSTSLSVFNPNDVVNTNNITQSLDLNGGLILRTSENPSLLASITIPAYTSDTTRVVNTDIPVIQGFYTTTPTGMYSIGQQIDFHIQYNYSVTIQNLSYSLPALLLKVGPSNRVIARYSSGSGTNTIVFVYMISLYDYQYNIGINQITTNEPIFQPLRIITSNQFNSLRRTADIPLLDTNINFDMNHTINVNFPNNMSWIGVATKVQQVWTPYDIIRTNFSAGDRIDIMVTFTNPISIMLANYSIPKIYLDVGKNNPGIAIYTMQYNTTTLKFVYEVSIEDYLNDGLYMTCACHDYFNRTYLELDESIVVSNNPVNTTEYIPVSIVLANTSNRNELRIDNPNIQNGIRIDRIIPSIIKVYSNLSANNNIPYSVGTVALISIEYDLNITIRGIIRLWLKGQTNPLPATYYNGNNTKILNFLYVFSQYSGIARLDYTSIEALDTSSGSILRYSDKPQIHVNTLLPRPGLQQSLGVQSINTINTELITIQSVHLKESDQRNLPYLSTYSVSYNLYQSSSSDSSTSNSDNYYYISRTERQETIPFSYLYSNTTLTTALTTIQQWFENSIMYTPTTWVLSELNYTHILLYDPTNVGLYSIPVLYTVMSRQALYFDNYWWNYVQVRSTVEFNIGFTRPVLVENAYFQVNTNKYLNYAYSTDTTYIYYLTVISKNPYKYGIEQEKYRLSYGGYVTRCISVTADVKSVFSIQLALEEIPILSILQPNVKRLSTRTEDNKIITYYYIEFQHLPTYTLHVVSGMELGVSCPLPTNAQQVSLQKDNTTVYFEYPIRKSNTIYLQADSDMLAGVYTLILTEFNGITIDTSIGIAPYSIELEKLSTEGKLISKTTIKESIYIPKVSRTSLVFTSNIPSNATDIVVTGCFEPFLQINDRISIVLPGFNTMNTINFTADSGNHIEWVSSEYQLLITILQNNTFHGCITEMIDTSIGLLLPGTSSYSNSPLYTLSVHSPIEVESVAWIDSIAFEYVSPVGVSSFTLDLSDHRPMHTTELEISFTINVDMYYSPDTTSITVYLPGFTSVWGYSGSVGIGGVYAQHFTAEWRNTTGTLVIYPIHYLQAHTVYTITILKTGGEVLRTPQYGLYEGFNQPSFAFTSEHWSSTPTYITHYPQLYGHASSSLDIVLTSDLHAYDVEELHFSANFTRSISGPAVLTLHLFFLSSTIEYIQLPISQSNDNYDSIIWHNKEKTLTITRSIGWNTPLIDLSLRNLSDFSINHLGVPENLTFADITMSLTGANGHLNATKIEYVTPLPYIQSSSLQLSTYETDIFNTTSQIYMMTLVLNTPANTFDTFAFNMRGMSHINSSNAYISNNCLTLQNVTNIPSLEDSEYTFIVFLNNNTHCKHETKYLQWNITELYPSDPIVRTISQYHTEGYSVTWYNQMRILKDVNIQDAPTLGITYSSIDIRTPYAGQTSIVVISILTASKLRTDDHIRIQLPGFVFAWSSTSLIDNYGRSWLAVYSSTEEMLILAAPMDLPPTALKFSITGDLQPVLPMNGISALSESKYRDNYRTGPGNITIGMERDGVIVLPQPVRRVTPVGKIHQFDMYPVRTIRFDSSIQTTISSLELHIILSTLSPLRGGDVILVTVPYYTFPYNAELLVSTELSSVLRARTLSATKQIEFRTLWDINTTTLDITILPSNAIQVGTDLCNQLTGDCPIFVSINSTSNPVLNQVFTSKEAFLLPDASVKFYQTTLDPTHFPTSMPSTQPSGQPSSQPTSRPSAQPSGSPIRHDPTAQPSVQPSSQPSAQPVVWPTSSPSAQPSSSPSLQPSAQPTSMPSMPTSQPTSQPSTPTSQPSTQPSSYPSVQPSSMPSTQPSSLPTSQPSSYPSAVPTVQPTSQPSSIPSTQPSSVPTGMPSIFDGIFALIIEIEFTLQRALSTNTILSILVPNLYSNLTINSTTTSSSTAIDMIIQEVTPIPSWRVLWYEQNQSIQLISQKDLPPGLVSIQLISYEVQIESTILYENDANFEYSIQPYISPTSSSIDVPYLSQVGNFGHVYSYGLKNASISFSTLIPGELSTVLVEIESDSLFNNGDQLVIILPGFILDENITNIIAITNNPVSLNWNPLNTTITINILSDISSVTVSFASFSIPTNGCNSIYNQPTIAYTNMVIPKYFLPTPFHDLTAISPSANVNISFLDALVGQETIINILIESNLHLSESDVLILYLPLFWSTQIDISINSTQSIFHSVWNTSTEQLHITVTETLDINMLSLEVTGLRLPIDGITSELQDIISMMSMIERTGMMIVEDINIQLVGKCIHSSLSFTTTRVDEDTGLEFEFALNIPIQVNETIVFHLPGFTLQSTTPIVYATSDSIEVIEVISIWDSIEEVLTLLPQQILLQDKVYTVVINDTVVQLPSSGIYHDDSTTSTSTGVTYTISIPTAVSGIIAPTPLQSIQYIGFNQVTLTYNRLLDATNAASLQISLQCTHTMNLNDRIQIYTPLLYIPEEFSSANELSVLNISGDLVEEDFIAPFMGYFNTTSRELILIVQTQLSSRLLTIFIHQESQLYISNTNIIDTTHTISGNFSSIGVLTPRNIVYTPYNHYNIQPGRLNITSCATYSTGCQWSFEFELTSALKSGESIGISHPNLYRQIDPTVQESNQTEDSIDRLNITGTSAEYMNAYWRAADNINNLTIISTKIQLLQDLVTTASSSSSSSGSSSIPTSTAVAAADYSWQPIDLTLSEPFLTTTAAIVSNIPQILKIYAKHEHSYGLVLHCDDIITIDIIFSTPVYILEPKNLKLLFNTKESAVYYTGNQTSILTFIYRITSPLDVTSLEVFGPGALEYYFSSPTEVNYFNKTTEKERTQVRIPANLTIPTPYGSLLWVDGLYQPMAVSCMENTIVTSVTSYTKKFITYATGDILDIQVQYNRPIIVQGIPILLLSNITAYTDEEHFVAKYVNISSIQWLEVPKEGVFTLTYEGKTTPCMSTNDTKSIITELSSLEGLYYSLPISILTFTIENGYKYRLRFGGVAPTILQQQALVCTTTSDEVLIDISMDSSVLNSAYFRYTIKEGDMANIVSYPNTSALLLDPTTDSITTAGSKIQRSVDNTLPSMDSSTALAITSGVRINTASPYVTAVTSSSGGRVLTSGDEVSIEVTFSAPITVIGEVLLQVNFTNTLATVPCCTVNLSATTTSASSIYFSYIVQMGDYAHYLSTSNINTLIAPAGSILLSSLLPSTVAVLSLPAPEVYNGLAASLVDINATALPIILGVYTNHSLGSFNAGERVFITIQFSADIHIVYTDLSVVPYINLLTPADASMMYIEGKGGRNIVFLYTVQPGDIAKNISFLLDLQSGWFRDPFMREFSELASSDGVIYSVTGVDIDTTAATVLRVDSLNPDSTYYPGDILDIYIEFSEPVLILYGDGQPSLELLLHSQLDVNLLAHYAYGNGTSQIHFTYMIPPPNTNIAPQSMVRVNYANADALYKFMNGTKFTDISSTPSTEVNVFLPSLDLSDLGNNRYLYIDYTYAEVVNITAISDHGIYTAGDDIYIQVLFTSRIMIFNPPVLKLQTGVFNRSAIYISGNFTNALVFQYTVQLNDTALQLDYINTRSLPYLTQPMGISFALNTIVESSIAVSTDTVVDIFMQPTEDGGVFMASSEPGVRVPAYTALPLPGAPGSLSTTANIVIDTTAPYIKLVTVPIDSGTYSSGVIIPITVVYSSAVVVVGCPRILFQLNGVDKYAPYRGGSGTTTLIFEYTVTEADEVYGFDYLDRFSLRLAPCTTAASAIDTSASSTTMAILRQSNYPQILANLTMPWVTYIESVVAPVSITGSGKILNLFGQANAPRLVWTGLEDSREYALGDVIDMNVGFTSAILFPTNTYIRTADSIATPSNSASSTTSSIYVRDTYFGTQINDTTVQFPIVVQPRETIHSVSYVDQFAMITDRACAIVDISSRDCTAQDLPLPFSNTPVSSMDLFSTKRLQIIKPSITISSIGFQPNNSMVYNTGVIVNVTVSFTDPVVVQGTPLVNLYLDSTVFPVYFTQLLSPTTLLFQANIDLFSYEGHLLCTRESDLNLNGGNIFREASFLPLLPPELKISSFCCLEECNIIASIQSRRPVVTRVYSPQNGVFSISEIIDIYVEFTTGIRIIGTPSLLLDLSSYPTAHYIGLSSDLHTIHFQYIIQSTDYTSALDYVNSHSLYIQSTGLYDGVYLNSNVGNITADLTLPVRGSTGSLGRETNIVINKDRPNIVTAIGIPTAATTGDDLRIIIRYSEYMTAVDSNGMNVFESDALQSGSVALGIQIILQPLVTTITNPIQYRTATLSEVNGTDVVFVYPVSAQDPTSTIYFSSNRPFLSNNVIIRSSITNTIGPIEFSTTIATAAIATIDNNNPIVLQVFSPNRTNLYPFGVGDVVDIYVEMDIAVIVIQTPVLELLLQNSIITTAIYIPNNEISVRILHFQYIIETEHTADPLEYNGRYALSGLLLRYSTRDAAIIANLELPIPSEYGSLGACCNIQIDSSPPYIESIIPLKSPGIYGENERIYIVTRFSKPVIVSGTPELLLTTSTNTSTENSTIGSAYYTDTINEYDIPIDIQSTDILFLYNVRRYDNILSLQHTDEEALVLRDDSSIKHLTDNPTLAADITLRHPSDHSLIDGRVYRQWKYRYPASVEVLLRDFYHTKPSSLTATVDHNGHINTLFQNCCTNKVFGRSYPKTRSSSNATLRSLDTGIGEDYLFSDITDDNIATLGIISQSSTRLSARRAVDGNVDPLVGDNSVSETTEENNAWWLVQLPLQSSVRSLTIWSRKPQSWINPITEIIIKSYSMYPIGRYRLLINNIDDTGLEVLTEFIEFGADALIVQRILEETEGLGNVEVSRRILPQCEAVGRGCGEGYESGYGHSYRLSFLSITVPSPNVTIVSIRYPGEPDVLNPMDSNEIQSFPLSTRITLIRTGYYIQIPEQAEYGKNIQPPTNITQINTGLNTNAWLTPFWVFLFNHTNIPSVDLNTSITTSFWSKRYDEIGDLLNIDFPERLTVSYVKIQREGYGSLSLAEIEIYKEKNNHLNAYTQGSPVKPSALTIPYQPVQSFKHTFNHIEFNGRWLIQLTQDDSLQKDLRGWSGATGTISEAVLIITDLAGVVHSYYQDLRAEVTSLPKYGQLTHTTPYTNSPYTNWRELFEIGEQNQLVPRVGGERSQGYCYGPDTYADRITQNADNLYQTCPDNFGVALQLNNRVLGDTAETVYLRNERVVVYKPKTGYLGPDYFTYIIYDGQNKQTHEYYNKEQNSRNEVTVHVRKCRPYQSRNRRGMNATVSSAFEFDGRHSLCNCAQTEVSIVNNQTMCDIVRQSICTDTSIGSGKSDPVASREHFLAMCITCMGTATGQGLHSGACQTQTIRAVSQLTSRGLCVPTTGPQADAFMDCSAETVTEPGREATNYLTQRPPTLLGSFSKLKNSFGAYGWYHTPLLT